ncbi:MAG TPA: nucleotidyl transferase AbiEii/AbiGii toxin family protein [Planctomycetota bacterium]|nr:nucleotidyl transferase AbiEii/AbiGii toxin family protein [Planctomycetota bacterium]
MRARLFQLSRHRGVEFQLLLSQFAIERLLYRLGISRHADHFVLKGATLFKLWSDEPGRATWDLDLLGRSVLSVPQLVDVVRELCATPAEDAIGFDAATFLGEEIRSTDEYTGVRVRLEARLAEARIPMQVDVGFGDAVVPAPRRQSYPTLLDHPAPSILTYPREAVVAEKLEAMVSLGVTNSRVKDFYDVHQLAASFAFDGARLAHSIRATFDRRRTPLPESEPLVLRPGFLEAPDRQAQWKAFLRRGRLSAPQDARLLAEELSAFLTPVLLAVARNEAFERSWAAGGPWLPADATAELGS